MKPFKPIPLSGDIDEMKEFDVNEIDLRVFAAINLCGSVIKDDGSLDIVFRSVMSDLLLGMIDTHKSMRLLLTKLEDNTGIPTDSILLARAQVESFFLVAWLHLDPAAHAQRYQKDAWLRMFIRAVLHELESANIPRLVEFYESKDAELLKTWADSIGLSNSDIEDARTWIEGGLVGKSVPSVFKEGVPTPGGVLNQMPSSLLTDVLERIYHIEYGYLCGFSHPSQLAGFTRRALRQGQSAMSSTSKWTQYYENHVLDPSYHNSCLSMLSVVTKCTEGRLSNHDLVGKLVQAWNPFADYSLSGRFVWDHWASKILGQINV